MLIVSVVGYEIDVLISDFVVDVCVLMFLVVVELLVFNVGDLQQCFDGLCWCLVLCMCDQLLCECLCLEGVVCCLCYFGECLCQQVQCLDDQDMCLCCVFECQLVVCYECLVCLEICFVVQYLGCILVLFWQKFDSFVVCLLCVVCEVLKDCCQCFEGLVQMFNVVSLLVILGCGYSIFFDECGWVICDVGQIQLGQCLKVCLVEGELEVWVEDNYWMLVILLLLD